MSEEQRILQYLLIDILNLKHGLEDFLHLIEEIHLFEHYNIADIKTLLVNTARHHITCTTKMYKLGLNWFSFDPGLGMKFILPGREVEEREDGDDALIEFEDIKVAVEDMDDLPVKAVQQNQSESSRVKDEKEHLKGK